jgi:hypothetical protein
MAVGAPPGAGVLQPPREKLSRFLARGGAAPPGEARLLVSGGRCAWMGRGGTPPTDPLLRLAEGKGRARRLRSVLAPASCASCSMRSAMSTEPGEGPPGPGAHRAQVRMIAVAGTTTERNAMSSSTNARASWNPIISGARSSIIALMSAPPAVVPWRRRRRLAVSRRSPEPSPRATVDSASRDAPSRPSPWSGMSIVATVPASLTRSRLAGTSAARERPLLELGDRRARGDARRP